MKKLVFFDKNTKKMKIISKQSKCVENNDCSCESSDTCTDYDPSVHD